MFDYTVEDLSGWKAKHGQLYEVVVGEGEEAKKAILRSPSRQDMSYAMSVKDPIKMSETILKNCWVAGDEEIKTDDQYFLGAISQIDTIMQIKTAEIKKL